jgi:hypothetical protein
VGFTCSTARIVTQRFCTLKVFLKDMFFCLWCLTVFVLIEQVCQCTRAAFWRAGVQETFEGLRRTQQRGTDEIALLGEKKNEPFLFVGGIIVPDLSFRGF